MNITDLLNTRVRHKTFGTGVITCISDNYLTIKFALKETKFLFPDAFEKFIIADDTIVQAEITKEINDKKLSVTMDQQKTDEVHKIKEENFTKCNQTVLDKGNRKTIENRFGPDYNVKYLAKQPILSYRQVEEQFGIKISGFGRGINRTTSAIVLISSADKKKTGFVYHDHWTKNGDYIYSGEGKTGNQQMSSGNKAIVDAAHDGKTIHLFVKLSSQEYYYQGVFSLIEYTYEDEKDETGNIRKEYKFRLRKQHT